MRTWRRSITVGRNRKLPLLSLGNHLAKRAPHPRSSCSPNPSTKRPEAKSKRRNQVKRKRRRIKKKRKVRKRLRRNKKKNMKKTKRTVKPMPNELISLTFECL